MFRDYPTCTGMIPVWLCVDSNDECAAMPIPSGSVCPPESSGGGFASGVFQPCDNACKATSLKCVYVFPCE